MNEIIFSNASKFEIRCRRNYFKYLEMVDKSLLPGKDIEEIIEELVSLTSYKTDRKSESVLRDKYDSICESLKIDKERCNDFWAYNALIGIIENFSYSPVLFKYRWIFKDEELDNDIQYMLSQETFLVDLRERFSISKEIECHNSLTVVEFMRRFKKVNGRLFRKPEYNNLLASAASFSIQDNRNKLAALVLFKKKLKNLNEISEIFDARIEENQKMGFCFSGFKPVIAAAYATLKHGKVFSDAESVFLCDILNMVSYSLEDEVITPFLDTIENKSVLKSWSEVYDTLIPTEQCEMLSDFIRMVELHLQMTVSDYREYKMSHKRDEEFEEDCFRHPEYKDMFLCHEDVVLYERYRFDIRNHVFNEDMQYIHDNIHTEYEGLTCRILDPQDRLGWYVGELTGCCQHINGAGATACVYSMTMPNSGVWVLENKQGKLIAQAEVWLDESNSTFVFDNIETSNSRQLVGDYREATVKFCAALLDAGYSYVIGKGYNKIFEDENKTDKDIIDVLCNIKQPLCECIGRMPYTDTKEGVCVFSDDIIYKYRS